MGRIRVGTSGYVYKHWRNLLYQGVPPSKWLERYAQVFDTVELQNDPSFEARGIMQVMEHPNGPFKMPAWPVRVDGKPPRIKPSPLLGQHSADVLKEWLGIGGDQIATLKSEGVL